MRTIFTLSAFLILLPFIANAQNGADRYTRQMGEFSLTLLSEGQGEGKTAVLVGADEKILDECAPNGTFPNATNAFLVQTPDRLLLIDTGYGRKLFNHLDEMGINPERIDAVLLTHTHGDHTGGLLRDGKAAFSKASLYISRPEYDWWSARDNSKPILDAYADRIHIFDVKQSDFTSVLPEIDAYGAFGHTPGHVSYIIIGQGSDRAVVWGDLAHAMAVQMPYPGVSVTYDSDPAQAARSRIDILRRLSFYDVPVAGMHVPYPGMGKVSKDDNGGYIFTPLK